jgi:hypothetical protein
MAYLTGNKNVPLTSRMKTGRGEEPRFPDLKPSDGSHSSLAIHQQQHSRNKSVLKPTKFKGLTNRYENKQNNLSGLALIKKKPFNQPIKPTTTVEGGEDMENPYYKLGAKDVK